MVWRGDICFMPILILRLDLMLNGDVVKHVGQRESFLCKQLSVDMQGEMEHIKTYK